MCKLFNGFPSKPYFHSVGCRYDKQKYCQKNKHSSIYQKSRETRLSQFTVVQDHPHIKTHLKWRMLPFEKIMIDKKQQKPNKKRHCKDTEITKISVSFSPKTVGIDPTIPRSAKVGLTQFITSTVIL